MSRRYSKQDALAERRCPLTAVRPQRLMTARGRRCSVVRPVLPKTNTKALRQSLKAEHKIPGIEFAALEEPSVCCWVLSGWLSSVQSRKAEIAEQARRPFPTYTNSTTCRLLGRRRPSRGRPHDLHVRNVCARAVWTHQRSREQLQKVASATAGIAIRSLFQSQLVATIQR